ncbi:unnamed protein product, partial [Mesorhabditis belari]|uniref:Uncharacterized protein n=1 Tax=Mesorhabditis belari TaxID=2138241 RepID=A0AAF3EQ93_9BILA
MFKLVALLVLSAVVMGMPGMGRWDDSDGMDGMNGQMNSMNEQQNGVFRDQRRIFRNGDCRVHDYTIYDGSNVRSATQNEQTMIDMYYRNRMNGVNQSPPCMCTMARCSM